MFLSRNIIVGIRQLIRITKLGTLRRLITTGTLKGHRKMTSNGTHVTMATLKRSLRRTLSQGRNRQVNTSVLTGLISHLINTSGLQLRINVSAMRTQPSSLKQISTSVGLLNTNITRRLSRLRRNNTTRSKIISSSRTLTLSIITRQIRLRARTRNARLLHELSGHATRVTILSGTLTGKGATLIQVPLHKQRTKIKRTSSRINLSKLLVYRLAARIVATNMSTLTIRSKIKTDRMSLLGSTIDELFNNERTLLKRGTLNTSTRGLAKASIASMLNTRSIRHADLKNGSPTTNAHSVNNNVSHHNTILQQRLQGKYNVNLIRTLIRRLTRRR